MGKNELTKEKAFELIAAVVDNEASAEERKAFMDFIAHDDDVRREYESIKKIKSLLQSRCPYEKAPESLKQFVKSTCKDSKDDADVPIYDKPCISPGRQTKQSQDTDRRSTGAQRWIFSAAASFLIVAAVWSFFKMNGNTDRAGEIYNVEEYAYEHFQKNEGKLVSPTISAANLGSAEMRLAQDYNMSIKVPALKDAEFMGIAYVDFVPNFKAPILEYYLSSEDQYIYIFAFQLDKLKAFGQLVRHKEAIKKCDKPKDFYVLDVKGKHVVSWKWNDVWYTAISNHNGNRLASLIEPLEYNPDE